MPVRSLFAQAWNLPRLRRGVVVGLVVSVAFLSIYPIWRHGALPGGPDTAFHLQLADGMARGLRDGHLYPRWLSAANRGFGSPALVNYPPLSAYLVALTSFLAGDVVAATRVVLLLSTLLSGGAFYLCARTVAPPLASGLAAALYILVPYRAVDVYSRFAFAEIGTLLWLPLLVKYLHDLDRKPSYGAWAGLALASAGLLLTHVITAFLALVVLGIYTLWLAWGRRSWRFLALAGFAAVAGAAVAAVYLIPAVYERGWTHSEFLIEAWWADWRRNLLFIDEVALGFKPAVIGPVVERSLLLTLLVALGALAVRRGSADREARRLGALCLLAVFLQLPLSSFVWRVVPGLEYVQFPWRLQTFLSLFACLLLARALTRMAWPSGLLLATSAALWVWFAVGLWQQTPYPVTADFFDQQGIPRMVMREHIPRGVSGWQRFDRIHPLRPDTVEARPEAQVTVEEWSSHRRRLRVQAKKRTEIVLRTFCHPGWTARIDGRPRPIRAVRPFGAIGLKVRRGVRDVELRFEPTPDRTLGRWVSLLAVSALALGFPVRRLRSRWTGSSTRPQASSQRRRHSERDQ